MSMPVSRWLARPNPENPVRDDRGYIIGSKNEFDESTWSGRQFKKLSGFNDSIAEAQRQMGYKVYEGDPGTDPIHMSHYEQCKAINGGKDPIPALRCNIL